MTKIYSLTLALLLLASCDRSNTSEGELQLLLPKPLREISGLAELPDGRLLAVADEKAQVYSIDIQAQSVNKFTAFGEPAEKGDFEGIAVIDQMVYLVTSDGVIWQQSIDAPPEDFETFDTKIGKQCEVEGLAAIKEQNGLLIVCKQARKKKLNGHLVVFRWSITDKTLDTNPMILRSYASLGLPDVNPSGLTLTADAKRLFFVAARQQYFFETTLSGDVVRQGKFPHPKTHPQTEGVVITAENTLYLADEGDKKGGTITRYVPSF